MTTIITRNLQNIVQLLFDGQRCYQSHVENIEDFALKDLFKKFGQSRAKMIEEVQALLGTDSVEAKGTTLGSLYEMFDSLKNALTKNDSLAIAKEIKRGENALLEALKQALNVTDDQSIKLRLLNIINSVEDELKQVSSLSEKISA